MYSVLVLFLSFVLWIASEKTLLHFRQAAGGGVPDGCPVQRCACAWTVRVRVLVQADACCLCSSGSKALS